MDADFGEKSNKPGVSGSGVSLLLNYVSIKSDSAF